MRGEESISEKHHALVEVQGVLHQREGKKFLCEETLKNFSV